MLFSDLLAQSPIHHPLTEHEIRETRLLVNQYQLEIEDSKLRIDELRNLSSGSISADVKADFEALINETINQKETMERLLAEKSTLISPVRRLPSELLALVMLCHVRENGHSPWTLLAVSRSWRYLGLETPRLWSLIHILQQSEQPNYFQPGPPFTGGVLCRNKETWRTALTRSGAVLLDMVIDCDLSVMPLDFFSEMVLESGPRWRSMVYNVTNAGRQWDIDWAAALFPNLQSSTFLSNCSAGVVTDGLLSAIESTSLKLRSMVIEASALETNLRARKPILQRIKELDLTSSFATLMFPPQADATWPHFPRLEVLVTRDGYNSTFLNRKDHNLANLRVFAAGAIRILADYSSVFKSLMHVYLENPVPLGNGPSMEPEIHSIALVNVTHFGLVSNSYAPLRWFYLPSLILLELLGNTMPTSLANEELDLIWNLETFGKAPSPIALHAEVNANDAYLLMALRSMDQLKELYLYYDAPQNSASKFMDSLAVKPKKSVVARGEQAIKKWVPPTCPELETLFMIYKRMPIQERVDISQKLQQIQEARLGTAREMKKLCLLLRSEHVYLTDNLGQQYMKRWPF